MNTHDRDSERWRRPDAKGRARRDILAQRHIIKRAVRDYFDEERFLEIDVPLLVRGTTPDAHIDSFSVDGRYLSTSAEYQIKRMETGGFDRLYALTQNFRRGDTGRFRNPEFTMLEWARVGESLRRIEQDAEKFTLRARQALGGDDILIYQGHKIDLSPPWGRLGVREAIKNHTGVDPADFTPENLIRALEAGGIAVKDDWRDDPVFLFTVLLDDMQGTLGFDRPLFLHDWPGFLTSSAKEDESGAFTERSELFIAGIEISDGFPSLTDPQRQRENFASHLARRRREGKSLPALDEKYLSALDEGLPAGAGMALGFDRLVMVLTDCAEIAPVLAFGWDEL